MTIHKRMKLFSKSLLLLFLITGCNAMATSEDVSGTIVRYGIIRPPDTYEKVKTPGTDSGVARGLHEMPTFSIITNRIPAKLGTRFGFSYEINNLRVPDGTVIDVVRFERCPAMSKPDGTTFTGAERPVRLPVVGGKADGYCGFGFDHEYELVPGNWTFEIRLNGKTLFKHDFVVLAAGS